jgi:hypothetical protein
MLAEVKRAAQQKKTRLSEPQPSSKGAMKFAEKRLLQLLLNYPMLQPQVLPSCARQDFAGLASEAVFAALLSGAAAGTVSSFDGLHRQFAGQAEQHLIAQLQMEEVPEDLSREAAESFLSALRSIRLASKKQEILTRIAEAVDRKDDDALNRLMEERVRIDRELVSLSRK